MDPAQQSSGGAQVIATSNNDLPAPAFYALTWIFFAICTIAYAVRAYIRYACFRRLTLEDYLMLLALIMHNAEAILIQLYVKHAYDIEAVQKGDMSKISKMGDPDFLAGLKKGFVGIGASSNLSMVGIFIVKLNFLLFFRRLGAKSHKIITILWWAVLVFTIAATAAQIGMQLFGCFFGDIAWIMSESGCGNASISRRAFLNTVFSATVDALSDFLIIVFPVAILARSRISMRKKVILTFVFSLVFLTIAITIVRGAVFHSLPTNAKIQSVTFTWFWFYCEFSVAILIACIVSFRTLFVQRNNKAQDEHQKHLLREAAHQSAMRRGLRARARQFHESVLETCKTLEDWSDSDETLGMRSLPGVPSGLMTVDFNDDGNWSRGATRDGTMVGKSSAEESVSAHSGLKNSISANDWAVAR